MKETWEELEFITIWNKAAQFVASTGNTLLANFSEDFSDDIKSYFNKISRRSTYDRIFNREI